MSEYKCEICGKVEQFEVEIELDFYVCPECVSSPKADAFFEKMRAMREAEHDWFEEQEVIFTDRMKKNSLIDVEEFHANLGDDE